MPITKASGNAVAPAAKGDLVVGSATNDASVLSVGTTGQVLTVDSATTTGVKWATADALPSQTDNSGKYLTTNGTTASWTGYNIYPGFSQNSVSSSMGAARTIRKLNGTWIATTDNVYIFYSTNGKTNWTRWASTATENITAVQNVAFGNGTYVFLGAGNNQLYTATSLGGTITTRTPGFGANSIWDVAWVGGSINLWIIVGQSGILQTSSDAITWTSRTANQSTANIQSIATDNTTILICSSQGVANKGSYSTNGTTWTAVSIDVGNTSSRSGRVLYDSVNARWLFFPTDGRIVYTSTPTSSWTTVTNGQLTYGVGGTYNIYQAQGDIVAVDTTNNLYINFQKMTDSYRIVTYSTTPTAYTSTDTRFRVNSITQLNNYASSMLGDGGMGFDSATGQYIFIGQQTGFILTNG